MRMPLVLFGLLLAMCGVVAAAFLVGEEPARQEGGTIVREGHGIQHPTFATMQAGGSGEEKHGGGVLWLGWVFGLLQILFFVGLLALGAQKNGKLVPMRGPLALGAAAFAGIFTLLVISYRRFMLSGSQDLVLSFPIPTAWMMYGVWGVPVLFIALYIIYFDRWIMSEDDVKRFHQFIESRTAREKK